MADVPPPSEWDHRGGTVGAAARLPAALLEAIGRDPVAAGGEPGAVMIGCVLLGLWHDPTTGEGRLSVQPHGELEVRQALLVVLEQAHSALELERDAEPPQDAG